MGIEALSRGALAATFVEHDAKTSHVLRENLEKLRLTGARIVRDDAVRALGSEAAAGRKYDLVLVDPPYDEYDRFAPALARFLPLVLAEGGLVVLETSARTEPELPLALRTSRRYGNVRVSLFE
jgi:16S rRNA (guanine966-N2)-methyltransferase